MIHHCYSAYRPSDPETLRRHEIAQQTWKNLAWTEHPVTDGDVPRLFREEGRTLPFLRDVFDFAMRGLDPHDIMVHTNSDIHVRSDAPGTIALALQNTEAVYCYRRDFGRLDAPLQDQQYVQGKAYAGHDMSAFRVRWWQNHRMEMPDMILGTEAWDPCLRILIDHSNRGSDNSVSDLIGHERHDSYWERKENRYRLKAQLHNLNLARVFMRTHGVNPRTYGIP